MKFSLRHLSRLAMMMLLMVGLACTATSCDDDPPPPPPGGSVSGDPGYFIDLLIHKVWQGTTQVSTPQGYEAQTDVYYFLDGRQGVWRWYYEASGTWAQEGGEPFSYTVDYYGNVYLYFPDGTELYLTYSNYTLYGPANAVYGARGYTRNDLDWLSYNGYTY